MKGKIPLFAHVTTVVLLAACLAATPGFGQSANDGFDPNVNGPVLAIAVQADGLILIGGSFNAVSESARTNLARLNVDGTLDTNFAPTFSFRSCGNCGAVSRLAALGDGKILIAGSFDSVNGQPRNGVARLHADGTLDTNFNNVPIGGGVNALLVLPDGKILLGGKLGLAGMPARQGLIRVDSNGVPDSFSIFGNNSVVNSLALQADGKILVGGSFSAMGGLPRANLGRLNPDGTVDTTFNSGASEQVSALVVQPDGKILVGGFFTVLGGQPRTNIGRLNPNGTLDTLFNPGASHAVHGLIVQTDGRILAGGYFTNLAGQAHSRLGRLLPDGSDDAGFHPGANSNVWVIAVQSDGGILVGGDFTTLGGTNRNHLGRLYPDGSLDATLNLGGEAQVYTVALQADGKIVVGGYFTDFVGEPCQYIARLNAGGSVDYSFTTEANYYVENIALQSDGKILVNGGFTNLNGEHHWRIFRLHPNGGIDSAFISVIDGELNGIIQQPDGKILVAGDFETDAGQARPNIARLNPDGSLDETFNAHLNLWAYCMALQPDGKVLVGGAFTIVNGDERQKIVRLLPTGRIDSTFRPNPIEGISTGSPTVNSLAIQPDGKILVGGHFDHASGQPHTNIARLMADGSVDDTFNGNVYIPLQGLSPNVLSIAVQADGKMVVGGSFHILNGEPRDLIGRLNSDGTLDPTFLPGPSGGPMAHVPRTINLALQTDGKILVPGGFTELSGQPRFTFGRITSGSVATQTLAINLSGSSVTWMRGGSAPEVQRVTIEQSADGTNYSMLGNSIRVDGGWQLTGLTLPAGQNFCLRARGWTVGGSPNGSSGLIESVAQFWRLPPPFISSVQVLGGGAFQFSFTNTNAVAFSVLASTNVTASSASWENLGAPVPVGNGVYQFTDPAATNHARRFYQLRTP